MGPHDHGTTCDSSYLEVRDGSSSSSPLIAKLCGRVIPNTIYSSGSSLWFKLHNADRWSSGYDFSYTSSDTRGCGGELFGTRGAVTSQDFPGTYNQTSDCYWTIRVPQGQQVQLIF